MVWGNTFWHVFTIIDYKPSNYNFKWYHTAICHQVILPFNLIQISFFFSKVTIFKSQAGSTWFGILSKKICYIVSVFWSSETLKHAKFKKDWLETVPVARDWIEGILREEWRNIRVYPQTLKVILYNLKGFKNYFIKNICFITIITIKLL